MTLDLATLTLVLFLVYFANGVLSLFMAWTGRVFQGAWSWVAGQFFMALGALGQYLKPELPPWGPIVLANGAYLAALVFFARSVWQFRSRKPLPRWIYALLVVALVSLTFIVEEPQGTRIVVFSGWMSLGTLAVGLLLLGSLRSPSWGTAVVVALPFLATAAVTLVRLGYYSLGGPDQDDAGMALYLLGSVLVSTVTLFGYFMMAGIKAEETLRQKDAEIEARNRKLVESGRSKDLFFSIIAHDLRGPIGGASRYVRKHLLGKMSGLEAKYAEVETLASALDKTNEFLEKLLWWSRAQLEDWVPELGPMDLEQTLEQALSLVQSAADLKEITVSTSKPPYPKPVADPESVQLILGNLLSNAVKFTLPGRRVFVRVVDEGDACSIVVEDEGVGMDAASLERLFRIEDKLSTHGTSGERGSGLGLLLARSLAERNHGQIHIESRPGVGTKAGLRLPKANQPPR